MFLFAMWEIVAVCNGRRIYGSNISSADTNLRSLATASHDLVISCITWPTRWADPLSLRKERDHGFGVFLFLFLGGADDGADADLRSQRRAMQNKKIIFSNMVACSVFQCCSCRPSFAPSLWKNSHCRVGPGNDQLRNASQSRVSVPSDFSTTAHGLT